MEARDIVFSFSYCNVIYINNVDASRKFVRVFVQFYVSAQHIFAHYFNLFTKVWKWKRILAMFILAT